MASRTTQRRPVATANDALKKLLDVVGLNRRTTPPDGFYSLQDMADAAGVSRDAVRCRLRARINRGEFEIVPVLIAGKWVKYYRPK